MIKRITAFVISALIFTLVGCGILRGKSGPTVTAGQSAEPAPSAADAAAGSEGYYSFDYKGTEREYILHIPDGMEKGAPLVCVLHGHGGSAGSIMERSNMNSCADKYGFAVVYPQGLPGKNSAAACWNAGYAMSDADDTGFLAALMEDLQRRYYLSGEETFAVGFSNGGFMCYELALETPDTFRAVASVAGKMTGTTWDKRGDTVSVPLLEIHGTGDEIVPVEKGIGGLGSAPALSEVIQYWAGAIGANELETIKVSDKVTAYQYSSSKATASFGTMR